MTKRADPVIPDCLVEGCRNHAPFGFQPVRGQPGKWACFEHRDRLARAVADTPQPKPRPPASYSVGDLFGGGR